MIHADAPGVVLPVRHLQSVSPDATALQSWTFLKESMGAIGVNAQDLLHVQEDLKAMQDDLVTQEHLWQSGKTTLLEEKQALVREIRALQEQVTARKAVKVEALAQKEKADGAEVELQRLRQQASERIEAREHQQKLLEAHIRELGQLLEQQQKDEATEMQTFLNEEATLRKEMAKLQQQQHDIEYAIHAQRASMTMATQKFNERVAAVEEVAKELEVRTVELTSIVKGAEGSLSPQEAESRVHAATQHLLTLQGQKQQDNVECRRRVATARAVAASESQKLMDRKQTVTSFCQPITAQHLVLTGLLRKCQR